MGNRVSLPREPLPQQWEIHDINSLPTPPPPQKCKRADSEEDLADQNNDEDKCKILNKDEKNGSDSVPTSKYSLTTSESESIKSIKSLQKTFLENTSERGLREANRYSQSYDQTLDPVEHEALLVMIQKHCDQLERDHNRRLKKKSQRKSTMKPGRDLVGTPAVATQQDFPSTTSTKPAADVKDCINLEEGQSTPTSTATMVAVNETQQSEVKEAMST